MPRYPRRLPPYLGAAAAVGLATLVRAGLDPYLKDHQIYATYFVALLLSAWLWGFGPSLLVLASGAVLAFLLFAPPRGELGVASVEHGLGLVMFLLVGGLAVALSLASRDAQRRAARGERRQRLLADAGDTLASSLDLAETLLQVAERAVPDLADWCAIRTVDDAGGLRKLACAHAEPGGAELMQEMYRRYPPDADYPRGPRHAMQTGRTDFIPVGDEREIDAWARDADHARLMRAIGLGSYLCAPLIARGRTLGTVSLGQGRSGRRFADEDRRLAEDLARRVALAIDNSRLLREAEVRRRRLEFLAEASATLASSLDYETTLSAVTLLAVPHVADWCAVEMAEPDGALRRLAVAHADPARIAFAQELHDRYPPDPEEPSGPYKVLVTGRPTLVPEITDAMLESIAEGPEHLAMLRTIGFRSYLGVPLATRDRVLGVLTLVSTEESGHTFGPDDLALAEELARRAAVAVDNARLFRDAEAARRRAEESRALLETLMGSAPIGLAFVDTGLRYVRVNEAHARIVGSTPGAVVGRTVAEVLPELAATVVPHYRRVLETGRPVVGVEIEGATPLAPGEPRHFLADYYPVRVAGGELLGVGLVVLEMTEKKRAERELRLARDAAEAANSAKDRFLAVLSHELRNPLAPILVGATEALESPETPEALRPFLQMTRRNVALEARLIDDLLDVTRIAHGKLVLDREPIDPRAAARQALEICRAEAQARGIELAEDLGDPDGDCAGPIFVEADPARLQQIAWNLIKNAIKFTPPGGRVVVRCRVAAPEHGDGGGGAPPPRWVLEVRDTGIGIAPEALERIFVPMEQGDPAVTRQFGGLGLGLAISRSLAETHGGSLRASSPGRGRGATFTLELPTCPPPASPAGALDGRGEAEPPAGLRILLVEDNADTLAILARLLRARGHEVLDAGNLADATALASGRDLDLIITDLGLPDGSGLDLMRTLAPAAGARGIALSGFGTEHDLRQTEQAGFAAHLTKPIDFPRLEAAIRHALARPAPVADEPAQPRATST
jgi:PAS domain S-box-containing protein